MITFWLMDSNDKPILDLSNRIVGSPIVSSNERGFSSLSIEVLASKPTAFGLYKRPSTLKLKVLRGGGSVWEGRVDVISLTETGVMIGALGNITTLADSIYTAILATSETNQWATWPAGDSEKFEIDTDNKLRIALQTRNTFDTGENPYLMLVAPQGGDGFLGRITANYTFIFTSTGYTAELLSTTTANPMEATSLSTVSEWSLTSTNGTQTGSIAVTLPASVTAVILNLRRTSTTSTSLGTNSDQNYIQLDTLRVYRSGTSLSGANVLSTILGVAHADNEKFISDNTTQIDTTFLTGITNFSAYDKPLTKVVDDLMALQTTPYEVAVWENNIMSCNIRGLYGRTWYVSVGDLVLSKDNQQLANKVRGVYQSETGADVRTAFSTDTNSIAIRNYTRAISVNTTGGSSSSASSVRDNLLGEMKNIQPTASFDVLDVRDSNYNRVSKSLLRSGDTIVLTGLSVSVAGQEQVSFRLASIGYNPMNDKLNVSPENGSPNIVDILALSA